MAQCRRTTYPPATWCRNPPRSPGVYWLRAVLHAVSPLIWRRLLVSGESTVADLHTVVQTAFGWGGERLHRFVIHGAEYGINFVGGPVSATPGRSGWAGWGCGWVSGSSMSTTSSPAGGPICASRRSWLPNPAGCIRAAPQGGE